MMDVNKIRQRTERLLEAEKVISGAVQQPSGVVLQADLLRAKANAVNSVEIPQALLDYLNTRAEDGHYDAIVTTTEAFGFSPFLLECRRWKVIVNKLKGQGLSVREKFEGGALVALGISW